MSLGHAGVFRCVQRKAGQVNYALLLPPSQDSARGGAGAGSQLAVVNGWAVPQKCGGRPFRPPMFFAL
jgi:hypothetical protein